MRRVSEICDGIIETGWLSVLIVLPLFADIHANRVFEPPKVNMLHLLVLLMLTAWLIKIFAGASAVLTPLTRVGRNRREIIWRAFNVPLVAPVLLFLIANVLSSVLSVAPVASWLGVYDRQQGTVTTVCYVVFFFLMLAHFRHWSQWERMAWTVFLTSVPVALYALLQAMGLDPITWRPYEGYTGRVTSTLGAPVWLGAYLIMAAMVTLERITREAAGIFGTGESRSEPVVSPLRDRNRTEAKNIQAAPWRRAARGVSWLLVACYGVTLCIQTLALVLTQSRGPMLGLISGIGVLVLLRLLLRRKRPPAERGSIPRKWLWIGSAAAVAVSALILAVLIAAPADSRAKSYVQRWARAASLRTGTAGFRVETWRAVLDMLTSQEPLRYSDGSPDRYDFARTLVGYGPETFEYVFTRHVPLIVGHGDPRQARVDRSHNQSVDTVVATGMLGFTAYLAVFLSASYWTLTWLGLAGSRWRFWSTVLVLGALSGVAVCVAGPDYGLLPVAVAAGLLLGVVAFAICETARGGAEEGRVDPAGLRVICFLFAAIVAHFVETQFGFGIATTLAYFWVFLAVVIAVGMGWVNGEDSPEALKRPGSGTRNLRFGSAKRKRPSAEMTGFSMTREPVGRSLLGGIVLATLSYQLTMNPHGMQSSFDILLASFGNGTASFLVVLVWVLAAGTIAIDLPRKLPADRRVLPAKSLAVATSLMLIVFLTCAFLKAGRLAASVTQLASREDFQVVAAYSSRHVVAYGLTLVFLVVTCGVVLSRRSQTGEIDRPRPFAFFAGGLVAVSLFALATEYLCFRPARADILYRQARAYYRAGKYDQSFLLGERAAEMAPQTHRYWMFQGELAFIAAKEDKPPGREVWLERSTDTLQEAIRLAALDPQYDLDMAKLLQYWGTWLKDKDPSLAQRKWRKAVKYWARAVRLNPRSPDLHNEFGRFQHHLERHAEAERLYRRSLEIDPNFAETHAFLSDLYRDLGQASLAKGNRARARDYSSRALASYRRAIEIKPDLEPSLKKLREAIERLEEVGSESE